MNILYNLIIILIFQELIAEKNIGRRKSIIMIASGTLVLVVIALVIAAIVLLSDSIDAASITKEENTIALEDILNGSLSPKGFNGTWISGMLINSFYFLFLLHCFFRTRNFIQKPIR